MWKLQDWFKRQELGREKETEKKDRDQGGGRETGPICFISTWVLRQKWTLVSAVAAEGRCRLREHLRSHAGLSLEGGAAGPQLGWTPAGQLCGPAAIVEQNSFLITHLASQFNRKYSSCIFFFPLSLNLKEKKKKRSSFSHWTIDYLLIWQLEAPIKLTNNIEKSNRSLINLTGWKFKPNLSFIGGEIC